jgi:hypothetical protein
MVLKILIPIKPGLVMAVLLMSAGLDIRASARDYGQYRDVDPATREWVRGLKDKVGQSCCDTAEGYPAEYEWDMTRERYKVRIEGEWYVVPEEAVIEGPNKLGYATVWTWWSRGLDGRKVYHVRCFLPGPGG